MVSGSPETGAGVDLSRMFGEEGCKPGGWLSPGSQCSSTSEWANLLFPALRQLLSMGLSLH